MCGIAGFWTPVGFLDQAESESVAKKMCKSLDHRGPDGHGVWFAAESGLAFVHTRLAIQDLSSLGAQPMRSISGRFMITYNGEVYNFRELAKDLSSRGVVFRGHSDTEVVLAAIETWGLENALQRFVGMFAFALWDGLEKSLTLVRDRMGEKPLYYGRVGRSIVFSSELKAIRQFPGFSALIDRESVCSYVRFGYIPEPASIYDNIHKLIPGGAVVFRDSPDNRESIKRYWSIGTSTPLMASEPATKEQLVEELDGLLHHAVSRQMISDVPIGAFLSGGVDSSLIAAVMQNISDVPVNTFTVAFDEEEFDESVYAKNVANYLGTKHTEILLSSQEALKLVPSLPAIFDEPLASGSQIPTLLISKTARSYVKVCLSGDGGDEVFAGYNRYQWISAINRYRRFAPAVARNSISTILDKMTVINGGASQPRAYLKAWNNLLGGPRFGDKVRKFAKAATCGSGELSYMALISFWQNPEDVVGCSEPEWPFRKELFDSGEVDLLNRVILWDQQVYLPGDNLSKVDRANMSVNLETRLPLLDHNIVNFSWKPSVLEYRRRKGLDSKYLLRQVLYKYVPKHLIERPKMGFSVPIEKWLRGPLREWAEDLLSEQNLRRDGIFNSMVVRHCWQQFLAGTRNTEQAIWAILMFQSWMTMHGRGGLR